MLEIPDLAQPLDLLADSEIIEGAQRISPEEATANPALIPTDRELVVYCTCPSDKTSREMTKRGPNFREKLTRICKLEGDALIFYSKLPRYGLCESEAVPSAGRYHVQMSACAVGENVKSVAGAFMTVNRSGPEQPVIFDCRDIPAGKPSLIEFDEDKVRAWLQKGALPTEPVARLLKAKGIK